MRPETGSRRDSDIRRILVSASNLAATTHPRVSRRLVAVLAIAFVLAGSVTGGTIAIAATAHAPSTSTDFELGFEAKTLTTSSLGTLVGKPIAEAASSMLTVPLDPRPAAASNLVVGFQCNDQGTYTFRLGSRTVAVEKCQSGETVYPDAGTTNVVQRVSLSTNAPSAVIVPIAQSATSLSVQGPGRFEVWVSWVHISPLLPSAAEKVALADGMITLDEYVAAANQVVGCMNAEGYSLTLSNVPGKGHHFGFAYDSQNPAANHAFTRCWGTQYKAVELKWIAQGNKQ
jgi:hypothetical protein